MSISGRIRFVAAWTCVFVSFVSIEEPLDAADDAVPDIGIFVVSGDAEVGKAFTEVLGAGSRHTTRIYASLDEAVKADVDVLVLAMGGTREPFSDEVVEAVKEQKVIGIGYGAAQLFGQLELEINDGACAHFGNAPKLMI